MAMENALKFRSTEIKLDFKDVLIVPRKSQVCSRKKVDIERKFVFATPGGNQYWTGVPIISSNMDTVTGVDSYEALQSRKYLSCFPKHFNKTWATRTRSMHLGAHLEPTFAQPGQFPAANEHVSSA